MSDRQPYPPRKPGPAARIANLEAALWAIRRVTATTHPAHTIATDALDVPAYGTPPTGGATWDITWDRCPTCPAPVMPDQDHTCLTSPEAEHDREQIRSYETGEVIRTIPT